MNSRIFNIVKYTMLIFAFVIFNNNSQAQNCNLSAPSIYIDFDVCHAFLDGSHADYSEFTAVNNPNASCGYFSLIGGYPYRKNAFANTHSCAPGYNNSTAMCISSLDDCNYIAGHDRSLIFDILVDPGANLNESLDSMSFYSLSNDTFQFIDGISGINNFPTKFGLRVLKYGVEVYRETDINTFTEWTHYGFSFSDLPEFEVNLPTIFTIEILPYCLVGADSNVSAWDIDEVELFAGCDVMGFGDFDVGEILVPFSTQFCLADSSVITFENPTASGDNLFWLVTDLSQNIIIVSEEASIDFSILPTDTYSIYLLANEQENIAFNGNQNINNLTGCFNLSDPLTIDIDNPNGGILSLTSGEEKVTILSGLTGEMVFNTSLINSSGSESIYVVVNEMGNIAEIQTSNVFDFEGYELGIYVVFNVSSNEDLSNIIVGQSLTSIDVCHRLSTGLIIEIINCLREDLDDNGVVANNDFLLFTNFLNNFCASPCRADFNDDGIVDNADFLSFVVKFNEVCN